jgi:molybdopterin synthase sulfur carrier subunit
VAEVRVRYYAGAAAAAGVPEEAVEVPAGTRVADLRALLADRHPGLGAVLAVSSLLLDGTPASDPSASTDGAAQVDVLPPFAGG